MVNEAAIFDVVTFEYLTEKCKQVAEDGNEAFQLFKSPRPIAH